MLPTFLVIGAQKAGTTSLHAYLREHPEVYMAPAKELDFFVAERNLSRGVEWYERQFAGAQSQPVAGEASPLYTMFPAFGGVPERIAGLLPDARLVYLVRDPFERLRSHYLHRVAEGVDRRPLAEVARDDTGLIAFSLYAMQIERYLEYFPRDQLLLVQAERLRDEREVTLRRVFAFIGADPDVVPSGLGYESHRTADKRTPRRGLGALVRRSDRMPRRVRHIVRRLATRPLDGFDLSIPDDLTRELVRQFRTQLPLLRDLIGDDFDGWDLD